MKKLAHILGIVAITVAAGCAGAAVPAAQPLGNLAKGHPHSEADVYFVTGMIPHHAQAIRMAKLCPTNAVTPSLKVLCERIIVGQGDEIALMRTWLADRNLPVPPADATHHRMTHNGQTHDMLMPGMITEEQFAQLQRARGIDFERLFLTFMIQHHEGAVAMVDELNKSPDAGLEEFVFRLAGDIYADQTTEIDRMQKMLAALPPR